MLPLLQTLATLGSNIAVTAARQAAVMLAGLLLAGSLLLASLGFMTLAAYRALVASVGDVHAPLLLGAAYLILTLLTVLAVQSRRG